MKCGKPWQAPQQATTIEVNKSASLVLIDLTSADLFFPLLIEVIIRLVAPVRRVLVAAKWKSNWFVAAGSEAMESMDMGVSIGMNCGNRSISLTTVNQWIYWLNMAKNGFNMR